MKTDVAKKVTIKIASENEDQQQDTSRNARRTLKVLQQAATDKENLAGRPHIAKDAKLTSETEKTDVKRKILLMHKAVQTESSITTEDLTGDEPSADYWKRLAEKRAESLNDSLQEIEKLKENVEALKEENKICKEMLEESKHMVEVLQELLAESDGTDDVVEEKEETAEEEK